ncbi:MAG: hypothetical protein ACOYZ6_13450 [Chloroflexota bacterium]
MNRGMLWFDNNPKTNLAVKIQQAADYYRRKYGAAPNLCFVHPSMLADKMAEDGKISIRGYRPVLPGYLWIGLAEKN